MGGNKCVAIGAIAVTAAMTAPAATATTTIYAGQKFLRDNDGLLELLMAEEYTMFSWVRKEAYIEL